MTHCYVEVGGPRGEGEGKRLEKHISYCLSNNNSCADEEMLSCLVKTKRKRSASNVEVSGRNDNKCISSVIASRRKDWWTADDGQSWLKKQNCRKQGAWSDKGSMNNTTELVLDTAAANKNNPSTMRNSRLFSPYAFESRRKEGESGTFHALPAGRSILGREAQGDGKNEPSNKITCGLVQNLITTGVSRSHCYLEVPFERPRTGLAGYTDGVKVRLAKNALTAVIQRAGEGPVVRLTVDAPVLMKVGDLLCLGSGLNCELELKLGGRELNNNSAAHHIRGGGVRSKIVCALDLAVESISVPNAGNNVVELGGPVLQGAPTPNLMGKKTSSSEHNGKAEAPPILAQLSTQACSSTENMSDRNSVCKKPQSVKALRLMHPSISNYLGLGDVQDGFSSHMGAFLHQIFTCGVLPPNRVVTELMAVLCSTVCPTRAVGISDALNAVRCHAPGIWQPSDSTSFTKMLESLCTQSDQAELWNLALAIRTAASLIIGRVDAYKEKLHIFRGRPQQLLARYLDLAAKAFKVHVKQCHHSASHSAASHAAVVIACNLCNAIICSGDIDAESCAQLLHNSALKAGWDIDDTAAFVRHRILIQSKFAHQFASVNLAQIDILEGEPNDSVMRLIERLKRLKHVAEMKAGSLPPVGTSEPHYGKIDSNGEIIAQKQFATGAALIFQDAAF